MRSQRGRAVALMVGLGLTGCVVEPNWSVVPGPGRTQADLARDDAACRGAAPATSTAGTTAAPAATGDYWQCMAARGESVVRTPAAAYPVYAAYPYPYPYAYPYYPYAYLYAPYVGYPGLYPAVGIGFGVGFWGGRGWGWHDGGWNRGGWHGGDWHGGGFHGRR